MSGSGMLDGRVVAITGGATGIGLATARAVLREGGRVGIQSRRADVIDAAASVLAETAGAEAVVAVPGDASRPGGVEALVDALRERFGRLDGFVAGAGAQQPVDVLDSTPADWLRSIEANLVTAVLGCQAAVPALAGGGSIVLIGSTAGNRGSEVSLPYATAKAGVSLLARTLAGRLGARGVRINCVVAGSISTAMLHDAYLAVAGEAEGAKRLTAVAAGSNALGRLAAPEEVGEVAAFLLSDRASFVTGSEVLVDGGLLASSGRPPGPAALADE